MYFLKRHPVVVSVGIALVALAVWLSTDLLYPDELLFAPASLSSVLAGYSIPDLLIQHVSDDGTVWAVRGLRVYRSRSGAGFESAYHVPSAGMLPPLANLSSLRAATGFTQVCELLPLASGSILAVSSGYIWRSTDQGRSFERVHRLRHYGLREGRGMMPEGMVDTADGTVFYAEYWNNTDKSEALIYRSDDDGITWRIAHRFEPGEVRHIHSLEVDPYTNALWVTTGDRDSECLIAYSLDKATTFHRIGSGAQKWRAVSLLFLEDSVFWGTDSPSVQNAIYRFDRTTHAVERVCQVDGPIYYSTLLCGNLLVLGSAVEGGNGEWDDIASLWLSRDGQRWTRFPLARRDSSRRQAVVRFAKGRCCKDLYFTLVNTRPFNRSLFMVHGELLGALLK